MTGKFGDRVLCLWCLKYNTDQCRYSSPRSISETGDYCKDYDPTPEAIFSDGIAPEQVRRAQRRFFSELGHD